MKKCKPLLSFLFFILLGFNALAQKEEVSKDLLLSTLNGVAHLKLDTEQETQLMDYNKGFVDQVYSVLDGDQGDKDKKKALKDLASVREKDLREVIGKHKTNKYLKLMEDELKPLAKRDHRLNEIAKS